MKIFSSVWMISHPVFKDMSCILENGKLNEPRTKYFARIAKECGATGMRVLPGLLVDKKLFENTPDKGYNYLPWQYDEKSDLFDLSKINTTYFKNLGKLAQIINSCGLEILFSLYDRCHWNSPRRIKSPWISNTNNVGSMYENNEYNQTYEDLVIETFKSGKNVFMLEFVNEPRMEWKTLARFCKRIQDRLFRHGIRKDQLISGYEWFWDGGGNLECNPDYGRWRRNVDFLDEDYKNSIGGYAVFHGLPVCYKEKHPRDGQKHSRKFFASTDGGEVLNEEEVKEMMLDFFSRVPPSKNKARNWCFEYLYFGFGTDLYGARGISCGTKEYFGYYPAMLPNGEPAVPNLDSVLPDPGNPPKTEPEEPPKPKSLEERVTVLEERVARLEKEG